MLKWSQLKFSQIIWIIQQSLNWWGEEQILDQNTELLILSINRSLLDNCKTQSISQVLKVFKTHVWCFCISVIILFVYYKRQKNLYLRSQLSITCIPSWLMKKSLHPFHSGFSSDLLEGVEFYAINIWQLLLKILNRSPEYYLKSSFWFSHLLPKFRIIWNWRKEKL